MDRKLGPDGGVLFAEDVLALDLVGTKLVTLSACHTASGEMQIGEGMLGLSRAFAVAGANDVVMSCWETPDAISRRLMTAFYMEWRNGRPPASALLAAKMQVRRFLPHPFYWNAFLYQGSGEVALIAYDRMLATPRAAKIDEAGRSRLSNRA